MIVNKVTKLYSAVPLDEAGIQSHLDEQNAEDYYLVGVDNINGWYRFFWAKQVEG